MKTKFFLLLALSAILSPSFGQNQRVVDSLTAVLATKVAGDRYAPSYELAFQFLDIDNARALDMVTEAERAALLSGDSLWIVKSKRVKGQILHKLHHPVEAISMFEAAFPIARRNGFMDELKYVYHAFGLSYLFTGNFDKALENFALVLDLSAEEQDTVFLALSLNNLGVVYYHLHDPQKALPYLLRAWDIKQQTGEFLNITPAVNISLCYSFLHDFSQAAVYLQKSRNECLNNCSEAVQMHQALASGRILLGFKQYDSALEEFRKSLALAKRTQDNRMILDNVVVISMMLSQQNRLHDAARYLMYGERVARNGTPFAQSSVQVYWQLCEVFGQLGDYRKLALYQKKYIHLKDSVFSYELTNRLMTAEADFKERENKAKIASQNQIIFLNQGIIHRQKLLNIVTALLALVTLAFAVFVFLNYRRKQHLNKLLELKVRDRTVELERSRDAMLRMLEENDLRMRQASFAIASSVNSIEGLCLTGRKEVSLPLIYSYLQRIGHASQAIVGNVEEYLRDGVLQRVP